MRPEVIDLFCGIGGLSAGFKNEGFKILAGLDSDASCRFAYETNIRAKFLSTDITSVRGKDIKKIYAKGATRVLIGCAPCQPFSIYTGRYRRKSNSAKQDGRWELLHEFARLVEEVKPDVVSMENVPRLILYSVFENFVERLRASGYHVTYKKVRADHYGVPQRRSRLVLFASKFGPVTMVAETHRSKAVTVRDAIASLPAIAAGEVDAKDRLHRSRGLGATNLKRIRATKEGGSWKDWDDELKLHCHKKTGGESFRSVYGRMSWDEPAPVITTQCLGIGNGRFGHPEQDRAISLREAALLQTFPANFQFSPSDAAISTLVISRQIGNAVPVRLGEAIARAIRAHLNEVSARRGRRGTLKSKVRLTKAESRSR